MPDENAAELIKRGDRRFSARQNLDRMRQELALNFAPHLAEWTRPLILGQDFASHLVDGTPLLLAREFVGQIGAMLRPAGKQWFWHRHHDDEINTDRNCREYLDWRSGQMMRIMTDRMTGFHRATKQADEFFGLFGDAVISVDASDDRSTLRVANWHTKNCTWAIGKEMKPDTLTRKEPLAARVVKSRFQQKIDKLDPKLEQMCEKDGEQTVDLRHEVIPADEYDAYIKKPKSKIRRADGWYSVWVDATHKTIIRETWQPTFRYVVPRWVTLTGNAYAISPAAMIALPDARLIQQQALAILEAAEKQVNPPLIAYSDAIRGDIRLDGITWVDRNLDERQGEPLRMLELGKNFRLGVDSLLRTEAQLTRAFFLDRLRMPDSRNTKSTLEVQFMIDEYIRSALPLFSPMQVEYNDPLLAEVDAQIEILGGYAQREVPEPLQSGEFTFAWNNPLTDMLERQKAQMLSEVAQLGQAVAALEAAAAQAPALQQTDNSKMFRETVMGIGAASWVVDERQAAKNLKAGAEANARREMMANAPQIADVVKSGAQAAQIASDIPQSAEPAYPVLPSPA